MGRGEREGRAEGGGVGRNGGGGEFLEFYIPSTAMGHPRTRESRCDGERERQTGGGGGG